ncbi:MAG TPA: hypothetical protein H9887_08340 [Candidatus Dorea intestinavium]|nr:hypothetical protein [Candidatus Dorea intestinavium]
MKVKDLIKELEKLNPEHDIYVLSDDEKITKGKNIAEVFDITDISTARVLAGRDNENKPKFEFFPVENGKDICFINFTTDF